MVYVSVDRSVILKASGISISRTTIKHMLSGLKATTIQCGDPPITWYQMKEQFAGNAFFSVL